MGKLFSMLEAESKKKRPGQIWADGRCQGHFRIGEGHALPAGQHQGTRSHYQEWRGTCSEKHYLLDQIPREERLESRVIMCTHRFTEETTADFPPELRELVARGPVPDVHTYIRLNTEAGWMTVDATWPTKAASLGMTVNSVFESRNDMTLACSPIETYEVPEGRDPQEFKEELIEIFCGSQTDDWDRFIKGLPEWLSKYTS